MEIIGDNTCITSVRHTYKTVMCQGKPRRFWLELQFVDENNVPVTELSVSLEYRPLASEKEVAMWSRYSKSHYDPTPPPNPPALLTDNQGLVRFDNLYGIAVSVKTDGKKLANEMELRPLGIRRNPNSQPVSNNIFKPETRDHSWRSEVQKKIEEAGHAYHYVTIGQLCDQMPQIENWEEHTPPRFHFPDGKVLKGTEIAFELLDKRHVIEICPFRAWGLALHDTTDYDLANALNLGIMADLVYANEAKNHTIDHFFREKCLDLSSIPEFAEFPSYFHTLAVDVPFRDRYLPSVYLSTRDQDQPEGDTRLFTVECGTHILVAWCGTDSLLNALTDASFGPKRCLPEHAGAGNTHGGFLEAYELAKRKFNRELNAINQALENRKKKLFICGHSLGGALALLYASEMKSTSPILYTFGMPRTFTRAALLYLNNITHYRHVNDNDTVTQVPLESDMDNLFYQTLGPLGSQLGFNWLTVSVAGLSVSLWQKNMELKLGLHLKRDPYWHHGNTVLFFRAQQCVIKARHQNVPWIGGGGKDNPAPGEISYREFLGVKLFLVSSLNDECLKATGDHQAAFIKCITPASLEKSLPRNRNSISDGWITRPGNHSMAHRYLPYIHNQVLELAEPERMMSRKDYRERFRIAVEKYASNNENPDEIQRNRLFLELHGMLFVALRRLKESETGKNALIRFAAVTEEEVEFSN